jgi:predicted nucleic acid-binding protein
MPGEQRVYWDACVPLAYINAIQDRVAVIDELLRRARAGEFELLTSVLSRVEVACAASEKEQGELDPAVEAQIDDFWRPGSPIKLVEFYDLIADQARALMRQGVEQGWGSLKPADAIHLATAQQMGVTEFHTYDQRLLKWNGNAGFPVMEPHTPQGVLDTTGMG